MASTAAAYFAIGPVQEVALVGDPAGSDTRALLEPLYARYDPNRVLALRPPSPDQSTGKNASSSSRSPGRR